MKEAAQSSSVYVNIDSCVLNLRNGERIEVSGSGDKKLMINILLCDTKHLNFNELVLKHYKNIDSMDELAKLCGFACTKTFSRHFIKSFNTTPKQWILEMREQEMVKLLQETNYTYVQISILMKFKNLTHFNNFCKKRTGLTPSEIRALSKSVKKRV